MKPHIIIGKLIAVFVFAVVLAGAVRYEEVRRNKVGREQFLVEQGKRFDKHYAKPSPLGFGIIACGVVMVVGFSVYELIGLGTGALVAKLIQPGPSAMVPSEHGQGGPQIGA